MEKLGLKTKLYGTRDELSNLLIHALLSTEQQQVYKLWLENTNEIIAICIERNKF